MVTIYKYLNNIFSWKCIKKNYNYIFNLKNLENNNIYHDTFYIKYLFNNNDFNNYAKSKIILSHFILEPSIRAVSQTCINFDYNLCYYSINVNSIKLMSNIQSIPFKSETLCISQFLYLSKLFLFFKGV